MSIDTALKNTNAIVNFRYNVSMEISHAKTGLSQTEVTQRLTQYGPNQLELKQKRSLWVSFFEEFKDLMVVILLIATIISFTVGEVNDGIVIIVIVLLNAMIGFVQKYKAEKAVEALKRMLAPQARVLRDSEQKMIPAEQIVPGDILILNEGDLIAADAEVFHVNELQTQESILTGESMPVEKDTTKEKNTIYMGTIVAHGSARAVVTATGSMTAFGKIATLTASTEKDKSPLEKELDHVGIFVGKITLIIAGILTLYGIFIQGSKISKAILFAASVAVAAVPEGLLTTITIALAIGVQRLAKKNAIMKQLSSVETLGSVTVIVSDKTGTLTKNEMTVEELITPDFSAHIEGNGYEPMGDVIDTATSKPITTSHEIKMIQLVCNLCNNAKLCKNENNQFQILGDPTEGALLALAEKLGTAQEESLYDHDIIHELPFDSHRKLMSVIVEKNGKRYILTKGAPDAIIAMCTSMATSGKIESLTEKEKNKIIEQNENGAKKALRMIGFAYAELTQNETNFSIKAHEKNLIYLGLCGIIDPPRAEVKEAIKLAHQAGIMIYILTGDHGLTAQAIGEKIGLEGRVITGEELAQTSDETLLGLLKNKTKIIFARVSPEDKLRVVSLLKQNEEIVAVTGDGVNDAPALKRADIGIAMGIAGTDVTKEAANMVLADDSFSTIVSAIQEGRTIYENLRKFVMFIFSSNIGELVLIFLAIILGYGTPLTAIMILLINIATDILPALALGVEPCKISYMLRPPRNPKEKILEKYFIARLFFIGTIIGVTALIAYAIGLRYYSQNIAAMISFAMVIIAQFFNAYNARDPIESAFKKPFSNPYLIAAILTSLTLIIAILEIPFFEKHLDLDKLNFTQWLIAFGLASITLFAEELRKLFVRSFIKTSSKKYGSA